MKHSVRRLCALGLLAAGLGTTALAADLELTSGEVYCFSAADFPRGEDGLLLAAVPAPELGALYLGNRQLRAGDAVPGDRLDQMTFAARETGEAVIDCLYPDGGTADSWQMTLKIGSPKNQPPAAESSTFQTYKNIPGQVPLSVSDPEGETLTITIVREPRRGTVEVSEDGIVTYTPRENKVGRDSFTYRAEDPAGNVSEEATVRVTILKPSDRQTYGDLDGDAALLPATWLRETGIFSGETVSGQLLFSPERTVTRGEFLAMCAALVGIEDGETVSTGFADEAATPAWLGPFVTMALRCGYLSGVPTDGGLCLEPAAEITQAQAAVLVRNILGLEDSETQSVMAREQDLPAWAARAASAMGEQGLYQMTDPAAALTRRDAAMLLYAAWQYGEMQERPSLLSWAAK